MRLAPLAILVASSLTLGACGEDSADEVPEQGEPTASRDAGREKDAGKTTDRDAGKDAGKGTDAHVATGAPDAGSRDASPPRASDAGTDASSSNDAGHAAAGDAGAGGAAGETGRMVGMTAAHNAVRAMVMSATPLPPLTWSAEVAAYAQQWADELAKTACSGPHHRTSEELQKKGYGENLATFGATGGAGSKAEDALGGWAGEVACYTYGTFFGTEKCDMSCTSKMHSDGCGHYTQVVWRKSTQVGCGVATCQNGAFKQDIWICNYSPAGNYVGQAPY